MRISAEALNSNWSFDGVAATGKDCGDLKGYFEFTFLEVLEEQKEKKNYINMEKMMKKD